MRFLLVVLPRAAGPVQARPPGGWKLLLARGQRGRVQLLPAQSEQPEVPPLLGYPPGSLGGDLRACDRLGMGQEPTGLPPLRPVEPFPHRHHHTAAWVSSVVRSRGVARALGLAIFDAEHPQEQVRRRLTQHEVVCLELPGGESGDGLLRLDREVLTPLAEESVARRVMIVATATPGGWSPFVLAGTGLEPLDDPLPDLERGAELLGVFLEGFHV